MIVAKVQSEVTQVQKQVIDKKMAGMEALVPAASATTSSTTASTTAASLPSAGSEIADGGIDVEDKEKSARPRRPRARGENKVKSSDDLVADASATPAEVDTTLEQRGRLQGLRLVQQEIAKDLLPLEAPQERQIVAKGQLEVKGLGEEAMHQKMDNISDIVQTKLALTRQQQQEISYKAQIKRQQEQDEFERLVQEELARTLPQFTASQQQAIVIKIQLEIRLFRDLAVQENQEKHKVKNERHQREELGEPRPVAVDNEARQQEHEKFERLVQKELARTLPQLTASQKQVIVAKVQLEIKQFRDQAVQQNQAKHNVKDERHQREELGEPRPVAVHNEAHSHPPLSAAKIDWLEVGDALDAYNTDKGVWEVVMVTKLSPNRAGVDVRWGSDSKYFICIADTLTL
jgi:pyrimidine operon attenuation protein/uracil phosphoribosyltransferase